MLKVLIFFLMFLSAPVMAQEDVGLEQRLALADKMLAINPPRDQVRAAIERYIDVRMRGASEATQEQFRGAMYSLINHKALEQIARESYAEVFTAAELAAMVEYYSKPEAKSARDKSGELDKRIGGAIVRMMDQALIRARTSSP